MFDISAIRRKENLARLLYDDDDASIYRLTQRREPLLIVYISDINESYREKEEEKKKTLSVTL